MKNLIKPLAYSIGGVSLFSGSFFLFAALSGTPLNDVAMVGDYFPDEEGDVATTSGDVDEIIEQLNGDQRSRRQVLEAASSPLRSFVMENPFSSGELEALEERLQLRIQELARREKDLDERELELDKSLRHVQRLYSELEELRSQVLAEQDQIDALQDEVQRDATAASEKEKAAYRAIASLFEEGKPATSAQMLIDAYTPEEVGQILVALDDERVSELMAAVHKIEPQLFDAFEEAYRTVK